MDAKKTGYIAQHRIRFTGSLEASWKATIVKNWAMSTEIVVLDIMAPSATAVEAILTLEEARCMKLSRLFA